MSTGTSAKVAPDTACCSLFWEIEKMKIFETCGVDKQTKIQNICVEATYYLLQPFYYA